MKPKALMNILYVHDGARALKFYRDAIGLDVVEAWEGWARLRCGDAFLALHAISPGMRETVAAFAGLNLEVDDLAAAIAAAVAGGGALKEIHEPEPHIPVRLAILSDTEGNVFELHQRV